MSTPMGHGEIFQAGPKGFVKTFAAFLFVIAFTLAWPHPNQAYVMPAEQVIELMATNFAPFRTQTFIQSTHTVRFWDRTLEPPLEERVWLQSPEQFRLEDVIDGSGETGTGKGIGPLRPREDRTYYRLLMSQKGDKVMELLQRLGVNVETVALTRADGIIAFRIGDMDPGSPKLLVEKERFLPLFLSYGVGQRAPSEQITVQFQDYRRVEQGWYPHEIVYFGEEDIGELHSIRAVEVNIPVKGPFFTIPIGPGDAVGQNASELDAPIKRRLRDLIKVLEDTER